jgi:hypothetical protein
VKSGGVVKVYGPFLLGRQFDVFGLFEQSKLGLCTSLRYLVELGATVVLWSHQ